MPQVQLSPKIRDTFSSEYHLSIGWSPVHSLWKQVSWSGKVNTSLKDRKHISCITVEKCLKLKSNKFANQWMQRIIHIQKHICIFIWMLNFKYCNNFTTHFSPPRLDNPPEEFNRVDLWLINAFFASNAWLLLIAEYTKQQIKNEIESF